MKLTAFTIADDDVEIRPAPLKRAWMDAVPDTYRCVPLSIANQFGWEICAPHTVVAWWSGDPGKDSIEIYPSGGCAINHFGRGILTFKLGCLFRTEPGIDLFITGPINRFKDGIAPQTAVLETDWNFSGFPMNWQFTRANHTVLFEKGEPFCHVFPVQRGLLERTEPEIRRLSNEPDLRREYDRWHTERKRFNAKLESGEAAAVWGRRYMRGVNMAGDRVAPEDHKTRMRLKPFNGLA